jgi:uncharacterized lipoprotein YddW (UPF0748 family)
MVPRALVPELQKLSPQDPEYVERIARWTRAERSDVEGLYASPINPAAAAYIVAVVTDLSRRYDVDGVHLDYVRYPRDDFDYSAAALREFRTSLAGDLASEEQQRLDARAPGDPLIYADTFPARWAAFRRSRLTALVMRIRTAVKAERPNALVSAAVPPEATEATTARLQDWSLWAQNGLLDAVCPMAYTPDAAIFERQIADALQTAAPASVWAGIGAYKLAPGDVLSQIQASRVAGSAGFILFSYDSMIDPTQSVPNYLEQIGRARLQPAGTAGSTR